ncbi:type VI secretion system membrane subunit TssM [Pseudaestuariivita rosea]|uniref:type VI secretion system membrane subunit TssM n=1 Tax=Pseudaestuariivita rosea TaxID=2763263 RepID=UPI001ABBC7D2|nr:type VI secretion system membrane subunit TssM [Pseudaestuariivita rosea]
MNPLGIYSNIRSWVDSYAGVLGRRFIVVIWVIAIAVIVWLFGPSLELGGNRPLEPVWRRLLIIGAVVLAWVIWMVMGWLKSRRAEKEMIDDIAESPEDRDAAETKEEIEELRSRLKDAMKLMRKVVGKRMGYAYTFPWYLMIGAPGAGKTTLLVNSGLKFPLGDAMGAEPLQGVGGTRNCNWWFTDRAILIDTAGRYTTQETAAARDKAGWLGFLNMLKRHRPGQPVNGVVITVSLTDLLTQKPEERMRDIRAIRQRLSELDETLGARIPIYVVLTKADQLAGFTQFFDGLGKDAREQVWGMTFDFQESANSDALGDYFRGEFAALQDRLNGLLLERLQQEPDIARRGHIFRFPAQIAQLEESLVEIVSELSSGTDFVNRPLMRGVYLASATQDDPTRSKPLAQTMNRSYFVGRLFSNVILGEAALVSRDDRLSRRRKILRGAGIGVMATSVVILLVSWLTGFFFNRDAVFQADETLAGYQAIFDNSEIPVRGVTDSDFLRVLGPLDRLASAPDGFDDKDSMIDRIASFAPGLNQERKIRRGHGSAYDRALGSLLLTRYMVHLRKELQQDDLTDAERFSALKYYLGLAGEGPIDREGLLTHAQASFEQLYSGSGRAATRENLMRHMRAMLDSTTLPPIDVDEDFLVAETREMIAEYSPSERAFDLLLALPEARAIPDWRPQTQLGAVAARLFVRPSGLGMDEGIDGIYTRVGYQTVVVPNLMRVSEIASGEAWVRGQAASEAPLPSAIGVDVADLYFSNFQDVWRDFLNDFKIRQPANLPDATELALDLSSETVVPLERVAREVATATHLTGISDNVNDVLPEGTPHPLLALAGADLPIDPLAAPDPYLSLRRALAPTSDEDQGNALSALQPAFRAVYDNLNRAISFEGSVSEVFGADSQLTQNLQELVVIGRGLPVPIDTMVIGAATDIADLRLSRVRQEISALWEAQYAQQCRERAEGRYPFDPNARTEVSIVEFSRLFGPDGDFPTFFDQHLAEFVDQTTDPWSWRGGLGTSGTSSEPLLAFQNAKTIQDAFFVGRQRLPRIVFTMTLREIDPEFDGVVLQIGRTQNAIRTNRDIPNREELVWPSSDGRSNAALYLLGRQGAYIQHNSEWGIFRLIGDGRTERINDDIYRIYYGNDVTIDLQTDSINNPIQLQALQDFTCPETLLGN